MAEHTPGPWTVMDTSHWSVEQRRNAPSSVCHVGDFTIVTGSPSYEFHGPDEADARLIAAAPELFAFANHPVMEWLMTDGLGYLPPAQRASVNLFLVPLRERALAKATAPVSGDMEDQP